MVSTNGNPSYTQPSITLLMTKPQFIVFEGLDACGKSTISYEFSQRHQLKLIGALPDSIKGWLPRIAATHLPEATFSYFTLCNLLRAIDINEMLARGEGVVLDRYFYTSYTYHKQLLQESMPEQARQIYSFQNLPKPDLVVFLDVPQTVRSERIQSRGDTLQWYGDKVSTEYDLTLSYFELFEELNVNVLRVDNHSHSVAQTLDIIESHLLGHSPIPKEN